MEKMSNSDEPMLVKQLHKKVVYWQNKYKELEEKTHAAFGE